MMSITLADVIEARVARVRRAAARESIMVMIAAGAFFTFAWVIGIAAVRDILNALAK